MINITDNLNTVRRQIQQSAENARREPSEICLLAVSKTRPPEDLRQAYEAGQRDFGENYLQESLEKIEQLQDLDICWHFIGPIQSNKTRPVSESFSWVHSVDRLKIAQRLSSQRPEHMPPLNICLQVNISGEDSKSGILPEDVVSLAGQILQLPNIRLRGLMAIPSPCEDPNQQALPFQKMAQLLADIRAANPEAQLDTLSMGMTGDMTAAISEGSTMVRIGTAIFGARDYSQKA
ncbi:YggS family pyridoxal phosphate-dependent enzyme [Aliamphritea hakodatensis]|uniref:YggS family pyridoxal phosphate-dependent enzyme n=1 Tax=Aliamphritea hakodatensis TaxID=2895352 RepID=UPI0022FD5E84|nr:YggS family pyridoxal phosphate-dependent enzyme [Aliamphritea hakodatensis]